MSKQTQAGFTLIELLVVISISALVVGTGLVGYLRFNDKQKTQGGVEEIKTFFRLAQTQAKDGIMPSGCNILSGYIVSESCSNADLCMKAVCSGFATPQQVKGIYLPGISVSYGSDIFFKVLTGDIPEDHDVWVAGGAFIYLFSISKSGEMTVGAWQ